MVYAKIRMHPGEWDAQNSLRVGETNRSPNPGLVIVDKKKNREPAE